MKSKKLLAFWPEFFVGVEKTFSKFRFIPRLKSLGFSRKSNKLKKFVKKKVPTISPISLLDFLVVFIFSIGLLVSPFIVNHDSLPKGYELPKVTFWVVTCIIITCFGLLRSIISIATRHERPPVKRFTIYIVILVTFILSTLFSPNRDTAFLGNEFRLQGLLTYMIVIIAIFFLAKSIDTRTIHLIFLSLIVSSLVQAGYGLEQFYDLYETDPGRILDGMWVNGTFGQGNFFAGQLLIGSIACAYYLRHKKWFIKIFSALSLFVLFVTLIFSYSIWGRISLVLAIGLIALYEILPHKIYSIIFRAGVLIFPFVFIAYVKQIDSYDLRIHMWRTVLNHWKDLITGISSIPRALIGYGLDTQMGFFKTTGVFPTLLIDRSHNFFFDVLLQLGIIGIILILALISPFYLRLGKYMQNRFFVFAFIGLTVWIFRAMVNTNSIVNIMHFFTFLAICYSILLKGSEGVSKKMTT